jgi:hypothetical protein
VLAAMRTYAKAHRGQCRSGEVRLLIGSEVESSSKSADDGSGGSGVGGVGSKESVAATGAPAVEGGSPTDPVRPSVDKAAKSDPIQRIVVSFRIKQ